MPLVRAGRRIGRTARVASGQLTLHPARPDYQGPTSSEHSARAWRLHLMCCQVCHAHDLRIHAEGPFPPRGSVIVTNHLSYLDPLVLGALFPLRAVAKSEVAAWPVVGEIGRSLGVLFVNRASATSGARVLLSAIRSLRQGVSILNFPEGTTTHGDRVLAFRRGIFGAARLARAPVVAASLVYTPRDSAWVGDAAFVPHYLRTAARDVVCRVRFSAPVHAQPGQSDAAFADSCRDRVMDLMPELR